MDLSLPMFNVLCTNKDYTDTIQLGWFNSASNFASASIRP